MHKLIEVIISVITVFLISFSTASTVEAALVAVLPIEVDETKIERAKDFNDYYWDVMVNRFKYPDYDLMDDDKVAAAVPENGLPSYERPVLVGLADQIDADIVIVMRLDYIDEQLTSPFSEERMTELYMNGEYASYNKLTDKYYHKKFFEKNRMEEELILKNDWQYEVFNSNLNRYINRTLEDNDKKSDVKQEKKKMEKKEKKNKKQNRQEEKV